MNENEKQILEKYQTWQELLKPEVPTKKQSQGEIYSINCGCDGCNGCDGGGTGV
jgi:hypothetical protein